MTQQTVMDRPIPAGAGQAEADRPRAGCGLLELPAELTSASVARRYLGYLMRDWQLDDLTGPAQQVASELVTNAVTAARACGARDGWADGARGTDWAGALIELGVWRTGTGLVIGVWDASPKTPTARPADPMDEGGRGLLLVEALGTSWGHYRRAGGKVVWCELAAGAPGA
jgi:hypothetical protein